MPTATYEELLADAMPALIETDEQYEKTGRRFGDLLGKSKSRTPEETKLMRLLGVLIEDYDRRHAMPPDDSTPAELLQFLMQHSGKNTAELLPVFGQPSHLKEALNSKRPISVDQARKLGKIFSVNPGLFI
jgi:antitoxin component HigA of HigAB toxin-antitoxin module